MSEQKQQLSSEQIESIVQVVQAGDKEQYRLLVIHFQRQIHIYCYHMLGDETDAEDAVQEILINAYRGLENYRPTISFSSWLYKIAHHQCINIIKQRQRKQGLVAFLKQESKHANLDYSSKLVEEVLAPLSIPDRQLLILKTVEERSFADISEIMNISQQNLRKKFERLKKKIQARSKRKGLSYEKQNVLLIDKNVESI